MDSDGAMDLVFTSVDDKTRLWLHVWYAILGTSSSDPQVTLALGECGVRPTPPASLCTRRAYLTFFKREWRMPEGWALAQTDGRPPTLSLADFDLNGFPDALLPLHARADAPAPCEPNAPCVVLLYNDERMRCAAIGKAKAAGEENKKGEGEGEEEGTGSLRLYKESASSAYPPPADERLFAMLAGATAAAFFDVYDDGVWDVIAMHPRGMISVWHRASAGGSYFLRATTTDGACAPDALAGVPGDAESWPEKKGAKGGVGIPGGGQCVVRSDGGGAFGAWASKPLLHQVSSAHAQWGIEV
jgi:integrin alpha FG-GAP repeat containing protein 1